MLKICKAEGCEDEGQVPGAARGLCLHHYSEYRRSRPHKQCKVAGCVISANWPGSARGYCSKHLYRLTEHGSLTDMKRMENGLPLAERLALKTRREGSCTIWTDKSKFLMWEGKATSARRLMYNESFGTEHADGMTYRANCGNSDCVGSTHTRVVWKNFVSELTLEKPDLDRFYAQVGQPNAQGCELWEGLLYTGGYGRFSVRQTSYGTHRVRYMLERGSIPKGMVLDHLCEVRNCTALEHLELVTPKVNGERAFYRPLSARIEGIDYNLTVLRLDKT